MNLSIVIPVYNENASLQELITRCRNVCNSFSSFEIICIDDGSCDESFKTLLDLKQQFDEIAIIKFHKNYGKSAALDAGFQYAKGEIIVTLDADLQNPPEEIPKLINALKEADAAIGWRGHRIDPIKKKIASHIANCLRNWILHDHSHDSACGLKAFHRHAIKNINLGNGMHRFLPALMMRHKLKVVEVKIQHEPRLYGYSKYSTMKRFFPVIINMLTFLLGWERASHYTIEQVL